MWRKNNDDEDSDVAVPGGYTINVRYVRNPSYTTSRSLLTAKICLNLLLSTVLIIFIGIRVNLLVVWQEAFCIEFQCQNCA